MKSESDPEAVCHAARIAANSALDMVKVTYTGSAKTFRQVVEGCPIPVLIAGGKGANDKAVLLTSGTRLTLEARVCIGRNAFQHKDPFAMMKAICALVHDNVSVARRQTARRGTENTKIEITHKTCA